MRALATTRTRAINHRIENIMLRQWHQAAYVTNGIASTTAPAAAIAKVTLFPGRQLNGWHCDRSKILIMKILIPASLAICGLIGCTSTAVNPSSLALAVADATLEEAASYKSAYVDLNGDGKDDAVVLLSGNNWCGSGGCTMLVFKNVSTGYALVSRSTVTREPVRVSSSVSYGWKDLIVSTKGVGDALMRFDGSAYPGNPSVERAATPEQVGLARIIIE